MSFISFMSSLFAQRCSSIINTKIVDICLPRKCTPKILVYYIKKIEGALTHFGVDNTNLVFHMLSRHPHGECTNKNILGCQYN